MSTERFPFTAENVPELDILLQEGISELEADFADQSKPPDAARELILRIKIQASKRDPSELEATVFKETKLPKRYGKAIAAVRRQDRILVERNEEDQELFPTDGNVTAFRKEVDNG